MRLNLRSERVVPWFAAALVAAPVLAFRYPPTIDFPQHEAMIALLRARDDAARVIPGMYEVNLGHPNQLFHLLAWALSYVLGVPLACRAVLAAGLAAIPLGMARLARYHGATTWVSLAMVPVALGWLLYWGFVANLLGVAALLFALPGAHDFIARPTARGALRACAWVVVLYLAHQLMLFVYLAALGLGALRFVRDVPRLALRLAPAAFGAAITVAQQRWQAHLFVPGSEPDEIRFLRVDRNLFDVAEHVFGSPSAAGAWLPMLAVVAAFVLLARARRDATARASRLALLGALCFVLYVFAPFGIKGASYVFQRFLAPALACAFVWAGSNVVGGGTRASRLALIATAALGVGLALPWFALSDRMARDLDAVVADVEPRSAIVGIDLDHDLPRERPFTAIHWAARAVAAKGGRLGLSFTTSPIAPVRTATAYQWNDTARRLERERRLEPDGDLHRFRYLILHSLRPEALDDAARALDPDARVVRRAGEWVLFESRDAVTPIDAPELPLEQAESLLERMQTTKTE